MGLTMQICDHYTLKHALTTAPVLAVPDPEQAIGAGV